MSHSPEMPLDNVGISTPEDIEQNPVGNLSTDGLSCIYTTGGLSENGASVRNTFGGKRIDKVYHKRSRHKVERSRNRGCRSTPNIRKNRAPALKLPKKKFKMPCWHSFMAVSENKSTDEGDFLKVLMKEGLLCIQSGQNVSNALGTSNHNMKTSGKARSSSSMPVKDGTHSYTTTGRSLLNPYVYVENIDQMLMVTKQQSNRAACKKIENSHRNKGISKPGRVPVVQSKMKPDDAQSANHQLMQSYEMNRLNISEPLSGRVTKLLHKYRLDRPSFKVPCLHSFMAVSENESTDEGDFSEVLMKEGLLCIQSGQNVSNALGTSNHNMKTSGIARSSSSMPVKDGTRSYTTTGRSLLNPYVYIENIDYMLMVTKQQSNRAACKKIENSHRYKGISKPGRVPVVQSKMKPDDAQSANHQLMQSSDMNRLNISKPLSGQVTTLLHTYRLDRPSFKMPCLHSFMAVSENESTDEGDFSEVLMKEGLLCIQSGQNVSNALGTSNHNMKTSGKARSSSSMPVKDGTRSYTTTGRSLLNPYVYIENIDHMLMVTKQQSNRAACKKIENSHRYKGISKSGRVPVVQSKMKPDDAQSANHQLMQSSDMNRLKISKPLSGQVTTLLHKYRLDRPSDSVVESAVDDLAQSLKCLKIFYCRNSRVFPCQICIVTSCRRAQCDLNPAEDFSSAINPQLIAECDKIRTVSKQTQSQSDGAKMISDSQPARRRSMSRNVIDHPNEARDRLVRELWHKTTPDLQSESPT
ncbi:uncharacterized protein LOC127865901 isoform X2 [Dreissena polymorpha]|uniref:uncharacterized protein LOC127865901 isoform X2 n=1 Tax=Dreissena polymorpha TaxID=45954 RepID=UPI0022644FB1|nr:uncharacterized protein LOC127865901 isoform X2 [Dreissena polymorpha]XP_052261908.1 uncharacterized protein LOC127865901 isoform X2 [Dreissena polymorpha]XP_052261909.1 uncharacterized protein LOC127865901 isoform X2 [Dreissena polymorpha]XP_052261910.1 uncharacterized protein LOC127865901 isoform X2 [Dreissena polymorpha]XP_052261911.1 uncharacterized protein LOC127865901 isoform X2 [Dreissena polymorpha]XP_052261912.1 uncharacterized protein LOC127865901 isoform X2 [Dreissena polymorpha]